MGRSIQIVGGNLMRGLDSHFQLDSLLNPRLMYKSNGEKARWQPPNIVSCLMIRPKGFTSLFMQRFPTLHSIFTYNWMVNFSNHTILLNI